jgi:hypothetical protein
VKRQQNRELIAQLAAQLLEPTRNRLIPPGISFMDPGPPSQEDVSREAVRQARMLLHFVEAEQEDHNKEGAG